MPITNTNRKHIRRSLLSLALGLSISTLAYAQSNTAGALAGKATAGDTITISNPNTGFTRTITVDSNGSYRVSSLPTGQYTIIRKSSSGEETTRTATVNVGTATSVDFVASQSGSLDTITVTGSAINPIDVRSVESATIVTEETMDRLPVQRDVTSVSLLAPGTTQGDSAFGNLASFGGATVGENAFYVNGFNITNFNNGLGSSTVPFEFISEQQVKTGGYGAEFGRSTGGVVNIVTKRGSNNWSFGANAYWEPSSLTGAQKDIQTASGAYVIFNSKDVLDVYRANLQGGGPIIKDRLFFYALGEFRKTKGDLFAASTRTDQNIESPFYALKLDWLISDDHMLEYTGFHDQSDEALGTHNYNANTNTTGAFVGTLTNISGGDNHILKYTGYLMDNFTMSALYGVGNQEETTSGGAADQCPFIIDRRTGTSIRRGCAVQQLVQTLQDERKAYRIDGEWTLGNHLLRFGFDSEERTSAFNNMSSGGRVYVINPTTAQIRTIRNVGDFETTSRAYYLEDQWQVTPELLLSLGIRNEYFDNKNVAGQSFIKIKNQWAPRLGFSWDVMGDGTFKVFGNAGRYHLPVVNNTNIRLAGGEYFVDEYYQLAGVNADFTPILGPFIRRNINSDGTAKDVRTIVDNDIDPMFQDEFILGFHKQLNENWSFGARAVSRNLKVALEDMAIDQGLTRYAIANNIPHTLMDCDGDGRGDFIDCNLFVLANPGRETSIHYDIDQDGDLDSITLTPEQLGFPASSRKYQALELFWERSWRDDWFLQGSYTFAKSRGNNEGFVRSDNGQNDAGLTTNFDQPGLLDGGYGYLPNDRRHTLKLFGAVRLAKDWMMSGNILIQSGRPVNCFGQHPTDSQAFAYGSASFYCDLTNDGVYNPKFYPRGSFGRTPWTRRLDLGVEYRPQWADEKLAVKVDVFNVFNEQKATEVAEMGELNRAGLFGGPVIQDPTFGLPSTLQAARNVRFSVSYDW